MISVTDTGIFYLKCKKQITTIEQTLAVCRSVWNFALRQRKDWSNSRKSSVNACSIQSEYIIAADEPFPNYHRQAKQLTEAKNQYPQLKTVHSQVLQQTLRTCLECEYTTTRDVASGQEIRNRGISALGHSVAGRLASSEVSSEAFRPKNVCGLEATGSIGHDVLVGTGRSRKLAS